MQISGTDAAQRWFWSCDAAVDEDIVELGSKLGGLGRLVLDVHMESVFFLNHLRIFSMSAHHPQYPLLT